MSLFHETFTVWYCSPYHCYDGYDADDDDDGGGGSAFSAITATYLDKWLHC